MIFFPFLFHFSKDHGILFDILWLFGGLLRCHADYIPDHSTGTREWPQDDKIFSRKTRFLFLFCLNFLFLLKLC